MRRAHAARILTVLGVVMTLLAMAPAASTVAAQDVPPPRPATLPHFYDASGIFPDDQLTTLQRDATLLQSSGIPTLVYVREATADEAEAESAIAFAQQLRETWEVESSSGADDGLVLLVSWVSGDHDASSAVQAFGSATFDGSGLSPASIQHTIDTSVASLIDQDKPFEMLVYLMRETRYAGIYAPPPPPPLEGAAGAIHDVLTWAGAAISGTVALILALMSRQFRQARPSEGQIWRISGVILAGAAVLWFISVYAQSRAGTLAALLMAAFTGIAAFAWTRDSFAARNGEPVRRRYVTGTHRLMRQRFLIRKMARTAGGSR